MAILKNLTSGSLLLQHNKGSKVVCFALKIFLAWVLGFFAVSYMMGGVKNIYLQLKDPLQSLSGMGIQLGLKTVTLEVV